MYVQLLLLWKLRDLVLQIVVKMFVVIPYKIYYKGKIRMWYFRYWELNTINGWNKVYYFFYLNQIPLNHSKTKIYTLYIQLLLSSAIVIRDFIPYVLIQSTYSVYRTFHFPIYKTITNIKLHSTRILQFPRWTKLNV